MCVGKFKLIICYYTNWGTNTINTQIWYVNLNSLKEHCQKIHINPFRAPRIPRKNLEKNLNTSKLFLISWHTKSYSRTYRERERTLGHLGRQLGHLESFIRTYKELKIDIQRAKKDIQRAQKYI